MNLSGFSEADLYFMCQSYEKYAKRTDFCNLAYGKQ